MVQEMVPYQMRLFPIHGSLSNETCPAARCSGELPRASVALSDAPQCSVEVFKKEELLVFDKEFG
jgi:hypothetical protein